MSATLTVVISGNAKLKRFESQRHTLLREFTKKLSAAGYKVERATISGTALDQVEKSQEQRYVDGRLSELKKKRKAVR